jgi:ribosomal protein L11 methyltransferase
VLVELAPALAIALRPGGTLTGSGVVGERLDEVLLALAAAGLAVERISAEADWRAIIARRPPLVPPGAELWTATGSQSFQS